MITNLCKKFIIVSVNNSQNGYTESPDKISLVNYNKFIIEF